MQPKHIEVVPYNPAWPKMFNVEAGKIKKALGDNCIAIHHVGSTSVPGLSAKPKIDIIAVVQDLDLPNNQLSTLGYTYRGGFNIPLHKSFDSKKSLFINFNLHIFEYNDPEIELNILFRDYLRKNTKARNAYEALKYELLSQEGSYKKDNSVYTRYTLGKHEFVQNILKKTGFNGLRFVVCTYHQEWEAYHRIRKEQLFDRIDIEYDPNHPTITADNHYNFALYKGTQIVSVAFVELLDNNEAALRALATDEPFKEQGYGTHLLKLIERWVKTQGRKVIKTHAALNAESFYRKHGYVDMFFDDKSISPNVVDLGKVL